jgi:hypothetical protein
LRLPIFELIFAQLKHEIGRKTVAISFYGFIETLGGDLVEIRQIGIDHYFLAADAVDAPGDLVDGN